MTREEFNKEMEEPSLRQQRKNWLSFKSERVQKELEHYEVPFKDYVTMRQALDMINEIHDDFESRTCENCKHGVHKQTLGIGLKMYMCEKSISEFTHFPTQSRNNMDFGCNKFEPE